MEIVHVNYRENIIEVHLYFPYFLAYLVRDNERETAQSVVLQVPDVRIVKSINKLHILRILSGNGNFDNTLTFSPKVLSLLFSLWSCRVSLCIIIIIIICSCRLWKGKFPIIHTHTHSLMDSRIDGIGKDIGCGERSTEIVESICAYPCYKHTHRNVFPELFHLQSALGGLVVAPRCHSVH